MINHSRVPEGTAADAATALMKASPPIAVSATAIAGVPLETWVLILTLIYLALQIAYLGFKFTRAWHGGKVDDGE